MSDTRAVIQNSEQPEPTGSRSKSRLTATKSHSSLTLVSGLPYPKSTGVTDAINKSFPLPKAPTNTATLPCLKAPGEKPELRNAEFALSSLLKPVKTEECMTHCPRSTLQIPGILCSVLNPTVTQKNSDF